MDTIRLAAIPVELLDVLWDRIEPHLAKALVYAKGECDCSTVKDRALKGDVLVVTVNVEKEIVAILTVMTDVFDTGKKALIVGAIGSASDVPMDSWFEQAFEVLKGIAGDLGCSEIRGHAGRMGWARRLKDTGWKEAYVTYIHEVEI